MEFSISQVLKGWELVFRRFCPHLLKLAYDIADIYLFLLWHFFLSRWPKNGMGEGEVEAIVVRIDHVIGEE